MPDDKDVILNSQSQEVDDSEAFTPTELASNKAIHDGKVKDDLNSVDNIDKETTEEDFEKFDLDAVDKLKDSKENN